MELDPKTSAARRRALAPAEILKRAELFEGLEPPDLNEIASAMELREFEPGDDLCREGAHAGFEIAVGDEFRMLAGDQQDVTETVAREMPRLALYGFEIERHAQDRVVTGEAAILARVNALVGKIQGREEPDGLSKITAREPL